MPNTHTIIARSTRRTRALRRGRSAARLHRAVAEVLESRILMSVYTVTTNLDNNSGGVTSTGSGTFNATTLREAITAVNTVGGTNTINLPSHATITLAGTELVLSNSSGNTTINGNGTTISGNYQSRVLYVGNGTTATLNNVVIIDGTEPGSATQDGSIGNYGGGILIAANSTLNMDSSFVANCYDGSPTTHGSGGGIFNDGFLTITDSGVTVNKTSNYGGGISNNDNATLTISSSDISNNTSLGNAGGILNFQGMVTVTNGSEVNGNQSQDTGGGISSTDGVINITDGSEVDSNVSHDLDGGGIAIGGGMLTIDNSTVNKNTALNGGGILVSIGATVTISGGSEVNLNTATFTSGNTGAGGGVYIYQGTLLLTSANANTASTISGNLAKNGGGIYSYDSTLTVNDGSAIDTNKATNHGGGIETADGGSATVSNSTIEHNSATQDGGAIFNTVNLTVSGSQLENNSAPDNRGGGIFNYTGGTANLTDSTVSGNTALSGGGLYGYKTGVLNVSDSTISGNSASNYGGGIDDAGTMSIVNATIAQNTANVGGAIYGNNKSSSHTVTVSDSTISGNSDPNDTAITSEGPSFALNGDIVDGNVSLAGPSDISGAAAKFSGGHNLIGADFSGAFPNGVNGNIINTNPMLTALGNYSLSVNTPQTMALLAGSPAIGAGVVLDYPGTNSAISLDERGAPRPTSSAPDIGAYEHDGITVTGNASTTTPTAGGMFTLILTVLDAYSGQPIQGLPITFTAPSSGASATINGGSTAVVDTNSQGSADATFTANSNYGDYNITATGPDGIALAFALQNQPASPAVYIVQTPEDDNGMAPATFVSGNTYDVNTLRDAIYLADQANSYSDIEFGPAFYTSPQTIYLTNGPLYLTSTGDTSIEGPASSQMAIEDDFSSSVFVVYGGADAIIENVTITGGNSGAASGGGVANYGLLNLIDSTITGNTTSGIEAGGGIYNDGTLNITGTTIYGNISSANGGGIANGLNGDLSVRDSTISGNSALDDGGISNAGTLYLYGTTISGNRAIYNANAANSGRAGGIGGGGVTMINCTVANNRANYAGGMLNTGASTITDCTISGNSATTGGGIVNQATATLNGDIVSGNTAGLAASDLDGAADSFTGTFNLIGTDNTGSFTNGSQNNQVGVNPDLAPLGDYGGPTETIALEAGSPAMGTGGNFNNAHGNAIDIDQRGFFRQSPDIGAFEYGAGAGGLVVTTSTDGTVAPGQLNLRAAVAEAEITGATITFATGVDALLTEGPITITANVTIDGNPGGTDVGPTFGDHFQDFNIDLGATVTMNNINIDNGNGLGVGGGIINRGTLTVNGGSFYQDNANVYAGAIYNTGELTITDSTLLYSNTYGIFNVGGTVTMTQSTIANGYFSGIVNIGGSLTVTDSTISGNHATGANAGGIYSRYGYSFNYVTETFNYFPSYVNVVNCTITGNTASKGGGIYDSGTQLTVTDSTITANSANVSGGGINDAGPFPAVLNGDILSNNTGDVGAFDDLDGSASSFTGDNNLIGVDNSGSFINGVNANIVGTTNPDLTPLGNYGGPTETMVPIVGSPAIDAGSIFDFDGAPILTDQRGISRPQGPVPNIGADESGDLVVNTTSDGAALGFGQLSLRDAINYVDAAGGDNIISFDPTVFATPQVITLTEGQLVISDTTGNTTINGPGSSLVTVSANGASRVFYIDHNVTAALDGITITGGAAPENNYYNNGGGIYNAGDLTLTDSVVSGNSAIGSYEVRDSNGGGIFNAAYSTLILNGSTITGNYAGGNGGGIFTAGLTGGGETITIADSTISNNTAGSGGGIYLFNRYGVEFDWQPAIVTITNSTITQNQGHGINSDGDVNLSVTDDVFTDNSRGAIFSIGSGNTLNVVNSTFTGNTTPGSGGAIAAYGPSTSIDNSTFYDNTAYYAGAFRGSGTITNSIFWDDHVTSPNYPNTTEFGLTPPTVSYSDVDQSGFAGSNNNIDANPDFVPGGLQLEPNSPAINDGENSAVPTGITTDLAGNNRFIDGVVDMGAYEAQLVSVFWTGNGHDQQWNDPLNWSDNLVPTANDDVTISGGYGTIEVPGGTFAVHSVNSGSSIQIDATTLFTLLNNSSITGALTILPGGTIDITNASLAVHYSGTPSATDSLLEGYLATGYHNGAWNGTGIISSTAAANPQDTVGYADGSVDSGTAATAGEFLIEYTLKGDFNLDRQVNFADLLKVAQNFNKTGEDWAGGNFIYAANGQVNFADLLDVAQNFNKPLLPAAATGDQIGGSIIPLALSAPVPAPATTVTISTDALVSPDAAPAPTPAASGTNTITVTNTSAAPTAVPEPPKVAQSNDALWQPTTQSDSADDVLQSDVNPNSILQDQGSAKKRGELWRRR